MTLGLLPVRNRTNNYVIGYNHPVSVAAKCTKEECPNILDTTGYPKWCSACRNQYQKDYRALAAQMTETRGFAAGVTAMRWAVAQYFVAFGKAVFSASEVAEMVRKLPGPGDVKAPAGNVRATSRT